MAFIQASPVIKRFSNVSNRSTTSINHGPLKCMASKPEAPQTFTKPDPRTFYVRPDKLLDVASLSLGGLLRLGSGALIEGYRVRRNKNEEEEKEKRDDTTKSNDNKMKKVEEYSSTLPKSRPEKPLYLFEFEACPFCRRVREAITMLDLDVIIFPTPRNGKIYRKYVLDKGGKSQFPYLEDPNTDFKSYESDNIIKYLYETYGPTNVRIPFTLTSATLLSAGLASSVLRPTKGKQRLNNNLVPSKKIIEIWAYEASPFCKLIRETLNDLEIAHLLHTTPRGSPTRLLLKQMTGRFQVPYIIDHNTGINMWESAEITEYLIDTYGPNAKGAIDNPTENDVFMPGNELNNSEDAEELPSLDPQPPIDDKLEKYCEENPDADECRIYED